MEVNMSKKSDSLVVRIALTALLLSVLTFAKHFISWLTGDPLPEPSPDWYAGLEAVLTMGLLTIWFDISFKNP
jgi:hypothetical protein